MPKSLPVLNAIQRNLQLDGLRAVSVLFVIISHSFGLLRTPIYSGVPEDYLKHLGWLGVEIFFGISGFIITRMQLEEKERHGRVSLRAFYVRRFFRIIPAYWAYLITVLILTAAGVVSVYPDCFVRSLLFISNLRPYPQEQLWFVGHSWTLSVEEQYYLFLPFLFWAVLKGKRGPILVALGILYFVSFYESRIIRLHLPVDTADFDFLSWFKYIIAGVFLALVWEQVTAYLKKIPILVPILALVFLTTRYAYIGNDHLTLTKYVQPTEALAVIFLIGWTVSNPGRCRFLEWPVLQWVGRCSFSLYLWQQLFTAPPEYYRGVVFSTFPLNLLCLFAIAAFSYDFIERPFNQMGHRVSARFMPPAGGLQREPGPLVPTDLPGELEADHAPEAVPEEKSSSRRVTRPQQRVKIL